MIRWSYAFIDRPTADADRAAAFWAAVTGTRPSPPWGTRGEFTTLLVDGADACLVTQAVGGAPGAHPDLEVTEPEAFTARATALGARVESEHAELTVLRSPGGQPFCVVPPRADKTPPPVFAEPRGGFSRLDQVCVDVGPSAFDAEAAFWPELTGWEASAGSRPEFVVLSASPRLPVELLLQRTGTDAPTAAHLDLACSDIALSRAWHEECGAAFVHEGAHWTVMRDPAGGTYCLTGRDPWAGRVS